MALNSASDHDAISVRAALERDFGAVARIQQEVPEAAQWPLGDYSGTPLLIAFQGKVPAGFCAWRQTMADEAELLNLAVDPAHRRCGVASALLKALCAAASGTLYLEVSEQNAPAIALYLSHGWSQTGRRKGYYQQGTIDAIVMKKTSC